MSVAGRELIDAACQATHHGYVSYSHFSVEATTHLSDNAVVTGTNQENVAYPLGPCAERTALFYANSQYPGQVAETLAATARNEYGESLEEPIPPYGACR